MSGWGNIYHDDGNVINLETATGERWRLLGPLWTEMRGREQICRYLVDWSTCPGIVPMNDRFLDARTFGVFYWPHTMHMISALLHWHRIRNWRNMGAKVIIGNSFARIVTLNWRYDLFVFGKRGREMPWFTHSWGDFCSNYNFPFPRSSWCKLGCYVHHLSIRQVPPFSSEAEDHRVLLPAGKLQ